MDDYIEYASMTATKTPPGNFPLRSTVLVLLLVIPLAAEAEPIIFDAPVASPLSTEELAKKLALHQLPDKDSPLANPHLNPASEYHFDKEEVIVHRPGIVEVLSDFEVIGEDQRGTLHNFYLRKGDKFESSSADSGVNINMYDGSDCLARIQGTVIYPQECIWLSGWNPKLGFADKVRFIEPGGEDEEWYRLVDNHGTVLGWKLRDWEFGGD
jgi:hypothetical protein